MHFALTNPFGSTSELASVLASATMFKQTIQKFGALYQSLPLPAEKKVDLKGFCNHLEKLNEARNSLVHAIWLTLESGQVQRAFRRPTAAKGLRSESIDVSAAEIIALADQLDDASTKLFEFVLAAEPPHPHASIR